MKGSSAEGLLHYGCIYAHLAYKVSELSDTDKENSKKVWRIQ